MEKVPTYGPVFYGLLAAIFRLIKWDFSMTPIPSCVFDVYALSLPRGLGFGDDPPVSAWGSHDHVTVCALTRNCHSGKHGILIMRRREDDVWAVLRWESDSYSEEEAFTIIGKACDESASRVPLPPGTRRRAPLWDVEGREPSNNSNYLDILVERLAHGCLINCILQCQIRILTGQESARLITFIHVFGKPCSWPVSVNRGC